MLTFISAMPCRLLGLNGLGHVWPRSILWDRSGIARYGNPTRSAWSARGLLGENDDVGGSNQHKLASRMPHPEWRFSGHSSSGTRATASSAIKNHFAERLRAKPVEQRGCYFTEWRQDRLQPLQSTTGRAQPEARCQHPMIPGSTTES